MTKKKLELYQHLKMRAKLTLEEYNRLSAVKTSLSSHSDGMPRASNKRTFEDTIAKLDELARKYLLELREAENALLEIAEFINSLDDPFHKNILHLKYVNGLTWVGVAIKLDKSERHLRAIRDELLSKSDAAP